MIKNALLKLITFNKTPNRNARVYDKNQIIKIKRIFIKTSQKVEKITNDSIGDD